MTDWQPIDSAPNDFGPRGRLRVLYLRDHNGRKWLGRRAVWSETGWAEVRTNREIDPTHWADPKRAGP
jgi:hypothetical protein